VYDKIQKLCKKEKKFCYELDGATEIICLSTRATEENKTCIFDNETNFCSEAYIMKNDTNTNKKIFYCFAFYICYYSFNNKIINYFGKNI